MMLADGMGSSDVLVLINLITPVVLGVIGWLLRRTIAEMDRRLVAAERQLAENEKSRQADDRRHVEKHAQMERDLVGKEDWLRESGLARQRQERIIDELQQLRGRQDQSVEIAAAIAAALTRSQERDHG